MFTKFWSFKFKLYNNFLKRALWAISDTFVDDVFMYFVMDPIPLLANEHWSHNINET